MVIRGHMFDITATENMLALLVLGFLFLLLGVMACILALSVIQDLLRIIRLSSYLKRNHHQLWEYLGFNISKGGIGVCEVMRRRREWFSCGSVSDATLEEMRIRIQRKRPVSLIASRCYVILLLLVVCFMLVLVKMGILLPTAGR